MRSPQPGPRTPASLRPGSPMPRARRWRKQMEQGAPADLFISADLDWMDYAAGKNLIKADTPLQSFGQQDRADRAQGLQDHDARPHRRRPRQGAGRRQAVDGQCRCRPGRQVRQGRAGEARCLDQREGQHRPGRERARRARCWWRAARRRSASSTAPTPRPSPASRSWRPSRRIPIRRSPTPPRSLANRRTPTRGSFLDFLRSAKARAVFEKQGFTVLVKSASST